MKFSCLFYFICISRCFSFLVLQSFFVFLFFSFSHFLTISPSSHSIFIFPLTLPCNHTFFFYFVYLVSRIQICILPLIFNDKWLNGSSKIYKYLYKIICFLHFGFYACVIVMWKIIKLHDLNNCWKFFFINGCFS